MTPYEADLLHDSLREEGYISAFHKFVVETEEDKKESKNES